MANSAPTSNVVCPMMTGGKLSSAIFSYRTSARLSKQRLKEEIIRKARHLFWRAHMGIAEIGD
jgi:hypothetical protein